MAKTRYNAIVAKVRDWSNKPDSATIPDSVIESCLDYAADEAYRVLRIPPLEFTVTYTVAAGDNANEADTGSYTSFSIPEDLTVFNYVRTVATNNDNVSKVFNEITDKRTFFDAYAEKYSSHNFMWMNDKLYIHPQLTVGTSVEINYYRRLPSLDALYSVIPVNYDFDVSDAAQVYLELNSLGTDLYFSTANAVDGVFLTYDEAFAYDPTVTTKTFMGREVPNWLRDSNERLLLWGALQNIGAYLFDDQMEQKYAKKFGETVASMNNEEKWRRATGGNVQMNINTGGMI